VIAASPTSLTLRFSYPPVGIRAQAIGQSAPQLRGLSAELSIAASEVHNSVGRAREARLLHLATGELQVTKAALKEFLLHAAALHRLYCRAPAALHGGGSRIPPLSPEVGL
jgi:hypothetical protein